MCGCRRRASETKRSSGSCQHDNNRSNRKNLENWPFLPKIKKEKGQNFNSDQSENAGFKFVVRCERGGREGFEIGTSFFVLLPNFWTKRSVTWEKRVLELVDTALESAEQALLIDTLFVWVLAVPKARDQIFVKLANFSFRRVFHFRMSWRSRFLGTDSVVYSVRTARF